MRSDARSEQKQWVDQFHLLLASFLTSDDQCGGANGVPGHGQSYNGDQTAIYYHCLLPLKPKAMIAIVRQVSDPLDRRPVEREWILGIQYIYWHRLI